MGQLGDMLSVMVGDARLAGRLVGRIEQPMSPPTVYRRAPPDEPGTRWRLQLAPGSDPQAVAARLLASAAGMGWPGLRAVTERDLRPAAAGHLLVLQRALSWVALSTGLVGVVALASALGSGVAERRPELAVLHALGAPNRLLALTVMGKAPLVVVFSLVLALALGGLIDPLLAERLGQITGQPLRPRAAGLDCRWGRCWRWWAACWPARRLRGRRPSGARGRESGREGGARPTVQLGDQRLRAPPRPPPCGDRPPEGEEKHLGRPGVCFLRASQAPGGARRSRRNDYFWL